MNSICYGVLRRRIFLLCTPLTVYPPCKELCHFVTDILRLLVILYPKQTHTQDILLLKGTKHHMSIYDKMPTVYEGQSISFRIEFFALVQSVVTTPTARGIIPKVSWASVLKVSFLCASCVMQL
jgi:hypothetical protein